MTNTFTVVETTKPPAQLLYSSYCYYLMVVNIGGVTPGDGSTAQPRQTEHTSADAVVFRDEERSRTHIKSEKTATIQGEEATLTEEIVTEGEEVQARMLALERGGETIRIYRNR